LSLKHAVLGFLYKEPLTGYDLSKLFDGSMNRFWNATHTQIYRTLSELNEEGLVFCQVIQQEQSPNKKLYRLSEKGREELLSWLKSNQEIPRIKDPFLLKISLISILEDEEIVEVLDKRIGEIQSKIDSLRCGDYYKNLKYAKNERERLLMYITLEYGVGFYGFELQWLKNAKNKLDSLNPVDLESDTESYEM
jgi:DNA-binding PadR family transcriptional regulator